MLRKRTALLRSLACLIVLACASPDQAQAVGIQSDEALKYDPATFLARADQIHADWVRLMVPYGRWHDGEDGAYVTAAKTAHDSGRQVMVSLVSWFDYPTPDQWAVYAQEVESRLAPYVDAWSVMNEPNLPSMAPRTQTMCVPTSSPVTPITSTVRNGIRIQRSWKKVRRGKGTYLRRHAHRHWRFVRAHGRKQHRRARWKRVQVKVPATGSRTVYVKTAGQAQDCTAEAFGIAYRRIYDRVAPIFKQDTGAQLVLGDLCRCGTTAVAFMDAFYSRGPLKVTPDVFGIHPYYGDTTVDVDYAAAHGLRTWATEWGVKAPSTSAQWTDGLAGLRRDGVRNVFVYDTGSDGGWDTRVPDDVLSRLAAAG